MLTAPLLVVCLWLLPTGTNGFTLAPAFQQLLTNQISTRLKEDFDGLAAKFANTTDPDFIEMANLSIWSVTMASKLNVNKSYELHDAFDLIRNMNRSSSVNSQLNSLEKGLSFITKIFRLYPESYLGTAIMDYLGFVMYCILKAVLQLGGFSIGVDWTNVIANLEKTFDQPEFNGGDISSKILEVGEAMMLGLTYYRDSLDILSSRSESLA